MKVSDVFVLDRKRVKTNPDTVARIAESIREIGLQNPISVCTRDGVEIDGEICDDIMCLVAGAHRREALISLGGKYEYVDAIVFDDRIAARKWEISENLHRQDLTALERDEHVDEWIALTEERIEEEKCNASQIVTHKKRGQQPEGVNAAARELGVNRMDAHRARKVASLPEEAKQAAREAGLDDNRTALLAAEKAARAAEGDKAEAAVSKIREIAAQKAAPKPPKTTVTADRALEVIAGGIIEQKRQHDEQELRDAANDAVERLGRDAMPYLLSLLELDPKKLSAAIRALL